MSVAKTLLATLLALSLPVLGQAYVLLAEQGTGTYWNPGDISIELQFGASPTLQDGSTWNTSAQAAFDAWNQHMTVLKLVGVPSNGTAGGDHDGKNQAFFSSTIYGQAFGPNVAAVTLIATSGNPTRNTEAEVVFNSAMHWDSYRGPLQAVNGQTLLDFRRVALHEFGHVSGLGHPDEVAPSSTPAIMNSLTGDLETLTADDIAGVAFLYGAGELPAFVEEPVLNVVPSLGTDIYFSCSVKGTPPFRYELYRDGQLAGADYTYAGLPKNTTLFYLSFNHPSKFGTYRIDLINRVGRVSSHDYVFTPDPAVEPVQFVSGPLGLSISRGQPSALAVFAAGKPAPTFRWFKDGQEQSAHTGYSFPLSGIALEAGTYQVWATNTAGVFKSATATVAVRDEVHAPMEWTVVQPGSMPRSGRVAAGNGRFVCLSGGTLWVSSDGMQWERHAIELTGASHVLVFGAGRFLLIDSLSLITGRSASFVSEDGVNWTRAEIDGLANGLVTDATYGAGRFVAVDLYGSTLRSSDGLKWEVSSWRAPEGDFLDSVAFGNGIFVISGRKDRVWTSTDGLTWSEQVSGVPTGMSHIAFGNGVFVGAGRVPNTLTDKAYLGISTDGVHWTNRMVQSVRGGPFVAFLKDRFHLYGDSSHLLSDDGLAWEQRNFTTHNVGSMACSNGVFLAVGLSESFISSDGLTWSSSGAESSLGLNSVVFTGDRFLVFDQAQYSEDGITWKSMPVADLAVKSATSGGGVWVAVGRSIGRAPDGVAWSTVVSKPQSDFASVTYGAGKFVAVGYRSWTGTGGVAYSSDGAAWTELVPDKAPRLRGVAYGPAGFIAVGASGTILQSTDGATWQLRDAHTTKELHSVVWDGTRYVAVGGDGYGITVVVAPGSPIPPNATVCTSIDGSNWSTTTLPDPEVLCSIASTDGLLIAGGTEGLTVFSTDGGVSWRKGPRAPAEIWRLAAGRGLLLATPNGASPIALMRISQDVFTQSVHLNAPPSLATEGPNTVVRLDTTSPAPATVKWYRSGTLIAQSAGTSWITPTTALSPGVYFADFSNGHQPSPVVLASASGSSTTGDVALVRENIRHPNGNLYDQYLLTGPSAQLHAASGRVSRVSFRDLDEDIVQVEFSGAGTLTLALDGSSPPGKPPNYNQDVDYVKGHARIYISDADETTNLSVFTVGRITAVDQSLFKPGITYDGVADIGLLAIHSRDGRFGGVRLGNASIWDRTGVTGLWAPDTAIEGPVVLGDIAAYDSASPGLFVRSAASVTIAGGSLTQPNGQPIAVDGTPRLQFSAGVTSHDVSLPAQRNAARFTKDGIDVTTEMSP